MPHSSQIYELVFPDGHVMKFTDFSESVNYTACKPFHKPLSFHGRIVDNLASWKISVSPDKTTYIIGIPFVEERKMIPVEIVSDKLPQIKDLTSFIFPFGSYFPNPGVWKVEGTDIVKLNSPIKIKIANKQNFDVKSANYDGEKLRICLSPLFQYDATEILNGLSKLSNQDVELTLSERKTGRTVAIFKSNLKIVYLPYNYDEVELHIPDTEYTMASRIFSSHRKYSYYEIKWKPYCNIIVYIDTDGNSDLKSRLNNSKDAGVIKWNIVNGKQKEEIITHVAGSSLMIKALPGSEISIRVKLDGYKPISETINNYTDTQIPKIVTVSPKLKLNKRITRVLKNHLFYTILGMICLISICLIAGFIIWQHIDDEKSESQVTATVNTSYESDTTFNTTNDDSISKIDEKYPVHEEIEEENVNTPLLTESQKELIKRLKGISFTKKDVIIAKEKLRGIGQDALIEDADACLKILNLRLSEKRELMDYESMVYNLTIGKLNYHKDEMMKIITSEEYLTISIRDFHSIEAFQHYINRNSDAY